MICEQGCYFVFDWQRQKSATDVPPVALATKNAQGGLSAVASSLAHRMVNDRGGDS